MIFGPVPVASAIGCVLAHSVNAGGRKLPKGTLLASGDIARLEQAGLVEIMVARPDTGDVPEDDAAARLAGALAPDAAARNLRVAAPFTGRVNIHATASGVLRLDASAIDGVNAVDPALTVATLPDFQRVTAGDMVATVKVMPYFVPDAVVAAGVRAAANAGSCGLAIQPLAVTSAGLLLTRTQGFADRLLVKGQAAVEGRLRGLGIALAGVRTVPHEIASVAGALATLPGDLILILGASATSDAADVCPAGLVAAGGRLDRFGMPVDPGNLLFLGALGGRPVIGLPGCARSPAMNGADWVLERIACGIAVSAQDIARMGVGGLLKEIATRPQPRAWGAAVAAAPRFAVILLAAGASRRMRGPDKLMQPVGGVPLIRHAADRMRASDADDLIVVLPPDRPDRRAALDGLHARLVVADDAETGMAASIRAGIRSLPPGTEAVILAFADMPDIEALDVNRLIRAYDPDQRAEIVRAVSASGRPGHPVLFGRRFFEPLMSLAGDEGARSVVAAAPDFLRDLMAGDDRVLVDLDTPEDWAAWRAGAIGKTQSSDAPATVNGD
jgi:molybdenum cofactor cytidylyltransferase